MLEGVSVALVALHIFVMSRVPVAVRTDMEGAYYGTLLQGKM